MEVIKIPRVPKYQKEEWAFFLDSNGRKAYNDLCKKCVRECKQSFRVIVIYCPKYHSKRSVKGCDGKSE